MLDWLIIAVAYAIGAVIYVIAICRTKLDASNASIPPLPPDQLPDPTIKGFLKLRKSDLRDARTVGFAVWVVLGLLSCLSFLLGTFEHCCWSRGGKKKGMIELWIWGWALASFLVLRYGIVSCPPLIIVPLARFFDMFYVLLRLSLLEKQVHTRGRALLQLLVHYCEVILFFGCVYIFIQQMAGTPIFQIDDKAAWLSPMRSLYFSFGTATTLGGGHITPLLEVKSFLINPHFYMPLEIFLILIILALDITHTFSGSPKYPLRH